MATALKLKNDIKKLKAAIGSKATPKSFVAKLKAQLDKAENELASLKKSGRPRKTSTTKGTEQTLSALQKLIQKKKYGVYQGAGVDLKKDAGEGALATGRRVSKGLKSNQWGDASDNKGNVYYEYRANRLDVKQPKKKQSYPKLEKGGYMAKGGSVAEIDMAEVESSAKYYTDESRWSKKPTIEKFKEDISEYQELKRKLDNKEITPSKIIGTGIKPNLARPLAYRWLNERTMVAKRAIEILEEKGGKMASGGYMADGGETDMLKEDDYVWNAVGKKLIVDKVTDDEYYLSGFMQKGASPWSKVKVHEYIKNGEWSLKPKMAEGGEVGRKFSIREMKEKLNKMFPDSFGFTVGNFSKEGDLFKNSSALIVDRNSPFNGLQDSEIKSNLFFPQYKRDHDIRFRIYQGGENTYFYFLLESENGDQYIGQFGFKDEGDVSADYITRFIAFLMEQYGLPFEVKHSVMAKGGYMAGGGEMHKADYFKDGGKVFSEKELKEILDEALGHFYQGLNQIDLAMRYLEVKGQGGLKKPLSDKLKLDDLRESIEKIDEYISK